MPFHKPTEKCKRCNQVMVLFQMTGVYVCTNEECKLLVRKSVLEAEKVNRSPAVDGIETWKCENCGVEWKAPQDKTIMKNGKIYDRTTDPSNWPVYCSANCTLHTKETT